MNDLRFEYVSFEELNQMISSLLNPDLIKPSSMKGVTLFRVKTTRSATSERFLPISK